MAIPREPTIASEDEVDIRVREDFLRPTVAGLRGGLTIRENFRAYVTPEPITFTTPDDWVPLSLAAGWAFAGGNNQRPQWRKGEDGRVITRGRITWVGPPAAPVNQQLIATVPSGWAPPARLVFYGFATGGTFLIEILASGALVWSSASTSFLNISPSGVAEWDAADRTPPNLAQPIKLPQVPFRPELVWVHAKDPSGREQVVQPRWQAATQGIVLQRLPGLAPLTKYSLMVYALAG